ncbi:MAG: 4Fe-4S binding protein [Planctomycetota bacterium]
MPLLLLFFNPFMFVIILVAALLGGYSAGNYNFGIMLVWILWWVLLMFVLVPVFARAWCLMCPFPIFSDWFQRKRLIDVNQEKPWGTRPPLAQAAEEHVADERPVSRDHVHAGPGGRVSVSVHGLVLRPAYRNDRQAGGGMTPSGASPCRGSEVIGRS